MWKKRVGIVLALGMVVGSVFAGSSRTHGEHGADPDLPGGHYSAKAKALVCGGCAGLIEKMP